MRDFEKEIPRYIKRKWIRRKRETSKRPGDIVGSLPTKRPLKKTFYAAVTVLEGVTVLKPAGKKHSGSWYAIREGREYVKTLHVCMCVCIKYKFVFTKTYGGL